MYILGLAIDMNDLSLYISACMKGFYGLDCLEACLCDSDKPCDHITGKCKCPPGFTGNSCQDSKLTL